MHSEAVSAMTGQDFFFVGAQLFCVAGQSYAIYLGSPMGWIHAAMIAFSTAVIALRLYKRREYFRGED